MCPDNSVCPDGNTCCKMSSGDGYKCCPIENGVCCSDDEHCCPAGYRCTDIGLCIISGTKGDSAIPFFEKTLALKAQVRDHKTGYEIPAYEKYPLVNASALKTPYN